MELALLHFPQNMASHQAICFYPSVGDILAGCEENVQERAAAGGRND